MTIHDTASNNLGIPQEKSIHLSLPDLLPENHTLVVNMEERIVILLYDEPGGEASSIKEHQFPPSGMHILMSLLQAYPDQCLYEDLLTQLYPIPVESARKQLQEAREPTMRPLRRAISTINADLRPFGLQVTSVRNTAYTLKRFV